MNLNVVEYKHCFSAEENSNSDLHACIKTTQTHSLPCTLTNASLSPKVCEYPDGTKSLKLGDFGLATVVEGPLYTVCGTPTYVAPEIIAETG